MNRLVNPYKLDESNPPLVHLQADVSQSDWDKIYYCFPFKGAQDKILSMLIHKFAEAVEQTLEPKPDPENEQRLAKLIEGIKFV